MKKLFYKTFCILHSAFCVSGGDKRSAAGFTLVELMIVMGVIAILVAMLFTVIIGAKEKARKKQALTEAHNIVLAIKGYRMEFDKWPNQTQATNDTTYFADNYLVVRELMGRNPRGKVFLAVQAINQTDSFANLIDPWGVPYVICMDEDMSGNCLIHLFMVPYVNNFASPPTAYYYSAINYSVAGMEVAVASFAGGTNATIASPFPVETWSEPQ